MSFRVLIDEAAPEAVGSLCEVRDASWTGQCYMCFLRHSSYIGLCLTIIRLFQAKLRQVIVVIFDTSFAGFRVQSAIPQESAALRSKAVAETILATVSKACSAASWLERYVVSTDCCVNRPSQLIFLDSQALPSWSMDEVSKLLFTLAKVSWRCKTAKAYYFAVSSFYTCYQKDSFRFKVCFCVDKGKVGCLQEGERCGLL